MSDPWIVRPRPLPEARMRLFCLPFAGGGALAYRKWAQILSPEIEVLALQLPGRESRAREPAHRHMDQLLPDLLAALAPWLDRPFALFGHSMGALIGYELAHELLRSGRAPVHLFASARRAPQLPERLKPLSSLDDRELLDELRRLDATPEVLLRDWRFMAWQFPLMRADFELNDTYAFPGHGPLSVPLSVYGGRDDHRVTEQELQAWQQLASRPVELRVFEGGHFYWLRGRAPLLAAIGEVLGSLLGPGDPAPCDMISAGLDRGHTGHN